MNQQFYQIARLNERTCSVGSDRIRAELDSDDLEVITNDQEFAASCGNGSIFWISGGGTIVIRNRYLPIVHRPASQFTGPARYSLFTGRAHGRDEWLSPRHLVRELFEEMIVFEGEVLLRPQVEDCQDVADSVWRELIASGLITLDYHETFNLKPIELPTMQLEISSDGRIYRDELCCHINRRNEINVLFAYSVDLDPARVAVRDGEFHREDGRVLRQNREVVLYDIQTGRARPSAAPDEDRMIRRADMSEHLQGFLDVLALPS